MYLSHLDKFICPLCKNVDLRIKAFTEENDSVQEGLLWCTSCNAWFPIQDFILDMLTGNLVYMEKRAHFLEQHSSWITENIPERIDIDKNDYLDQKTQQLHSDWFACNDELSYDEYTKQPCIQVGHLYYHRLFKEIIPSSSTGGYVIEVGCGIGSHTPSLAQFGMDVMAFDISEAIVKQARSNFLINSSRENKASFFLADATNIPIADDTFDVVMLLGILHHLPSPKEGIDEMARLLKNGGMFFATENNKSCFRWIFDLLQKIWRLWDEKAGNEPTMSKKDFSIWLNGLGITYKTETFYFLPPHLLKLLPKSWVPAIFNASNNIGKRIPLLKNHGGWINVYGYKEKD